MTLGSMELKLQNTLPPIPMYSRIASVLKLIWMLLTYENPLIWNSTHGRAHPRADISGPYYILGAPDINFAPGKAILGATQDLRQSPLFLFLGKILGPEAEPVKAVLDIWQANTSGAYAHTTYRNRGKVTTNPATGEFEIFTVSPGKYGFSPSLMRTAHIHAAITAPGYKPLVTQFYIFPRNDLKALDEDFINWVRSKRPENMLECWAIPTDNGDRYGDFPRLESSDQKTVKSVEEWNRLLQSEALRIGCGASDVIKLNRA